MLIGGFFVFWGNCCMLPEITYKAALTGVWRESSGESVGECLNVKPEPPGFPPYE